MGMIKDSFKSQSGFSLIEMLIVLLIIGVLATGAMFGVAEFRSVKNINEGEGKIYNLKAQVLSFGQVNKFLPCPDTDYDGYENRISSNSDSACSSEVGTAPYVDLGLPREGAQDAWGNFIRYAINSDADDPDLICVEASSASYFCRSGFNVNWFSFNVTPPLSSDRGVGNYYVCNNTASGCNVSSVTTPSNLEVESASIVLVAYNEDGSRTLGNCSAAQGASKENCDVDEFYQNGVRSTEDGAFYDDVVLSISGYEIKKALLGETIVWDSFQSSTSGLTPTYEDFDITNADNQSEIETLGDDVIAVRRNVDTALNLGAGDDYIAIGNDLNAGATLRTGTGNDTVYIVGQANSAVLLGSGDDTFVLATNLTNYLNTESGNDKVWIQGSVESSATFRLDTGDDVVWLGDATNPSSGNLATSINGGSGYDILVLENMTKAEWDADGIFQSYVDYFELVIFKDDGSGTREYCLYSGATCS